MKNKRRHFLSAREDRYNHLVSDEDDDCDDEDDIEIGNFSTCSPRFSRLLSTSELKDFSIASPLKEASSQEGSSTEDLNMCEEAFSNLDIKVNGPDEVDGGGKPVGTPLHVVLEGVNEEGKGRGVGEKRDSGNDSGTQTCSSSLDGCASPCRCEASSNKSTKSFEDDQDTE